MFRISFFNLPYPDALHVFIDLGLDLFLSLEIISSYNDEDIYLFDNANRLVKFCTSRHLLGDINFLKKVDIFEFTLVEKKCFFC